MKTSSARILVVEDELIAAYDLAEILEQMSYEIVAIADTATEAIEIIAQEKPDLVLMDIELRGGLRGTDVAAMLKDQRIPVVYLTAFSDEETLRVAAETSPYGYLNKPPRVADLRTTLSVALAKHRQEQQTLVRVPQAEASSASRHPNLIARLCRALDQQEFELFYQPQFDLHTGSIIGAEALIRWPQIDGSWISPADFIPAAEATGLIVPLGDWVIYTACTQARRWSNLPRVAINLSVVQLQQPNFTQRIAKILKDTRLSPESLEIEVTESLLLEGNDQTIQILHQLREMGVHTAVDDFGAGYSSLRYLQNLTFSSLKIDRCFVRSIHQCPSNQAIVTAITQLATSLDLKMVAEGIETPEEATYLKHQGCLVGQGYLFSKPLSADSFAELLNYARAAL
ncbi:two-component system response regulator [Almyronema epifaneia]|uniref:EAL domain-containing protein n=1 Tax=Almyronema epifaneia S1 TaxID=2991925 RepID=A0ABW6IFE4_9CYAN